MKLFHRRFLNSTIIFIAFIAIVFIQQLIGYSLNHSAFFSGWLLLSMIALLYLFRLRKKITGIALFKVSSWMQFHIYMGLLAAGVFLLHVGWQMPEGLLKRLLYFLFIGEALSGIFGLVITRLLPACLARNGSVLYQDIIAKQQDICSEVESLVEQSLNETDSNTIANFFQQHLLHFLLKPRNFWHHIAQSKKKIHKLKTEIDNLQRYLNDDEQNIINKITKLVTEKNRLDYQYAGQTLLKRWLFVHIPLSYGLLLFSVLHLTLVYAYIGGV